MPQETTRREEKSGGGKKLNTMSIQPVGDEGKERKNGVDRTKAACEKGKLNTTWFYDRLNESEFTAGWRNSASNWCTSVASERKKNKQTRKSE